jgi:hypothetical protein
MDDGKDIAGAVVIIPLPPELTSQPETIPSCYRRPRHAEFQPLAGLYHPGVLTYCLIVTLAAAVRQQCRARPLWIA